MGEIKAITIEDNEAYLRQISTPVDIEDKDLGYDIEKLKQFCLENDVLAMAAVQIGIPKRLVYVKNTNLELIQKDQENVLTEEEKNYDEAMVMINPIIKYREGLTEYWEACASCMDYMGLVKRPYKMEVEYETREGKKQVETFIGFPATVVSHELDHLDGVLHMDVAEEVFDMPVEERKEFRKTHDYTIISKTGNYEDLKKEFIRKKII